MAISLVLGTLVAAVLVISVRWVANDMSALVVLAGLIGLTELYVSFPVVTVGPAEILLTDSLTAIAGLAGLTRATRQRFLNPIPLILLTIFALNLARGLIKISPYSTGLGYRHELPVIAALILGSTARTSDFERCLQKMVYWGCAISVIVLLSVAGVIPAPTESVAGKFDLQSATTSLLFRVVGSDLALICAAASLYLLNRFLIQRFESRNFGLWVILMSVVVYTRHRSVWVGLSCALLVLLIGPIGRKTNRLWATIVGFGMAAVCLLLLVLSAPRLVAIFGLSLEDSGTGQGRLDYWRLAAREQRRLGWFTQLFGRSYGEPWTYDRFAPKFSPHNLYLQWWLRQGIVGALTLGVTMVWGILRSLRRSGDAYLLELSLVMLLTTYWLFYSAEITAALLIGCVTLGRGYLGNLQITRTPKRDQGRSRHGPPLGSTGSQQSQ
jgi:O-antigen ligase